MGIIIWDVCGGYRPDVVYFYIVCVCTCQLAGVSLCLLFFLDPVKVTLYMVILYEKFAELFITFTLAHLRVVYMELSCELVHIFDVHFIYSRFYNRYDSNKLRMFNPSSHLNLTKTNLNEVSVTSFMNCHNNNLCMSLVNEEKVSACQCWIR